MELSGSNSDHQNDDEDEDDYYDEENGEHNESPMRLATDFPEEEISEFPLSNHNQTIAEKYINRRQRIIERRKAFEYLPVYFSSDLCHGSWWFVLGSLIAMLIPIVPLLDLFYSFW